MTNSIFRCFNFVLLLAVICFSGLSIAAQNNGKSGFCSENNRLSNYSSSSKELREVTVAAVNGLTVDADRNGGIEVKGENRADILIRSCVQGWANSESAAQTLVKDIRVETGTTIRTVNPYDDNNNWSVSYQILVPRLINLKLSAYNGGISISGVDGMLEFETKNGGISLLDVAGDVVGKTVNGGVSVKLTGIRWDGNGLNVETVNGGASLEIPKKYAAHLDARTVNGGFTNDFGIKAKPDRSRGVEISTDINGGGTPIRIVTKNGGLTISSSK